MQKRKLDNRERQSKFLDDTDPSPSIFLLAFVTSLESQTTTNLTVYATSAFAEHSLVATVLVVQGVVNCELIVPNAKTCYRMLISSSKAVVKPPMAKIANVFGRLEAFSISVAIYVVGYIQQAASNNVKTFAAAQIFYSAGSTGLQILQQIFIADTSDLLNRALFSSLPDVPFLVTTWAGPPLANSLLAETTWRWGYGIWAIVLPVAFLPLALSLLLNARKAKKLNLLPVSPWKGRSLAANLKKFWYELDVMGLLLLSAAISLILIPLTLAASATNKWHNGSIIAMLVVGCICLPAFIIWESFPVVAPHPFLSLRLLRNRTLSSGCIIGFFYFAVFYTSIQPYFSSYLQVVHSQSVTAAGHITQTFTFTSTVTSIIISLFIKYTRHYKYFITFGASIYLLGVGLLIRYRSRESSISQIVGTQIAIGIGGGSINVPAQLGVQASVPHTDVAAATAIFLTILEIGGAVGSAISGAIWSGNLLSKLQLYLPEDVKPNSTLIFGNLTIAKSFASGSPEKLAIDRGYQETMDLLLICAACLCAPILPLSFLMRNYKLDEIDQRVRGKVIGRGDRDDNDNNDHAGDNGNDNGNNNDNEETEEDDHQGVNSAGKVKRWFGPDRR